MSIDLKKLSKEELMNLDLKKLKKNELIEVIEIFKKEEQNTKTEKEEVQELKNEIQKLKNERNKTFGAKDENDYLFINMDLISTRKTVKALIEENDTLKKELKEKELLNKKIQKLNNEHNKMIKEIKESNGVQKIKNERGAGRKSKFTDKEIERILKCRNEHKSSIRTIARDFGCSIGLIHKIINEHNEETDDKETKNESNV